MSSSSRRVRGSRHPLVLGAVAALGAVTLATAPQAQAALTAVSPTVDPVTGFPSWYQDSTGTKLKLCIDSDLCLGGSALPDPDAPPSLATGNLPDEAFYAVARAETALDGGGRIRWRAVLEGAFANDVVRKGDQITFARVQVTGDKIANQYRGKDIRFETPYGDLTARVGSNGKLSRERLESDPGDAANGFRAPLTESLTGFGDGLVRNNPPKFLRWDAGAPEGYIGNPAVPHRITGGVRSTFQAFLVGGGAISPLETRFEVAGQKAP